MRPKAFTFIEVLVVLTIFSVIILAVYGVSRGALELYRRSRDFDLKERKIVLSLERLASDLRRAIPLDRLDSDLLDEWHFEGKSKELSFVAFDKNGLCRFSYLFVGDEDTSLKLRLMQRYVTEEDIQLERDLADGIKRGSLNKLFQYLRYDSLGDSYEWVDAWDEEEGLPKAVKVEVSYEEQIFTKKIFILQ